MGGVRLPEKLVRLRGNLLIPGFEGGRRLLCMTHWGLRTATILKRVHRAVVLLYMWRAARTMFGKWFDNGNGGHYDNDSIIQLANRWRGVEYLCVLYCTVVLLYRTRKIRKIVRSYTLLVASEQKLFSAFWHRRKQYPKYRSSRQLNYCLYCSTSEDLN